jgi:glycosyltransferase involved in cell wall biosynthesis
LTCILHTIAGLKSTSGGVARTVPRLCEALAAEGESTVLFTQRPRGVEASALRFPEGAGVDLRTILGYDWERLRVSYTPRLARSLDALCRELRPAIWHDHGAWLQQNHVAAELSRQRGIARVVSPRGMLQAWSLAYRGLRKRLAWLTYQHRDLRAADAFSVTSQAEARDLRSLGLSQPVAVIPNGIDVPEPCARVSHDRRTVLFLSRLHPKKGLMDLVDAWAEVRPADWQLVIAGPDEDGHRAAVERAVDHAGVRADVTFTGDVDGSRKTALFAAADVFVLPSHSENFGVVVGEALAHGVPAITTTSTPWDVLPRERCGWLVPPSPQALAAALREATTMGDNARRSMGQRGAALIAREFSWRSVAKRHIALYGWLLRGGEQPAFVLEA